MSDIQHTNWSETAGSNNAATPNGWPEGQDPGTVNDCAREMMGAVKREWNRSHVTISSTGSANAYVLTYTTAPTLTNGMIFAFKASFSNTGAATVNVNALGAIDIVKQTNAGQVALIADDIVSTQHVLLSYDSTTGDAVLLNPQSRLGADATETVAGIAELATQAETNAGTDDARIVTPLKLKTSVFNPVGKHLIPVRAGAMRSATTNGAALTVNESTTNKVGYASLDFDTTTKEYAWFEMPMPSSWDEGTVTFRAVWSAASGSGGVAFSLQGLALSDDDAIDTAYGTAVTVTDTLLLAGDMHRSAESTAVTIAGTPAASDVVMFRIAREVADAADTLAVDAKLIGIELFITTAASVDV